MKSFVKNAASVCIITVFASSVHATSSYRIKDLGALPFTEFTSATDISANGQISGVSHNDINELGNPSEEGFVYKNGSLSPVEPILGRTFNTANAINNSGQITGTTYSEYDHPVFNAYIYDNGVVTDLGQGTGNDINNAGQVVGTFANAGFENGFLYENGVKTSIGTLPGHRTSQANAINTSGLVTGTSFGGGSNVRAFVYQNGVMTDLGSLVGSLATFGRGINDLGQVVGAGLVNSVDARAFSYIDGVMTDLGTLEGGKRSGANDVNNLGQIVGSSDGTGFTSEPILYENGVMYRLSDLITSGDDWVQLFSATAINDRGDIVGGAYFNGSDVESAYLLSHVPVPASFWLFASGMLALVGRMQKKGD